MLCCVRLTVTYFQFLFLLLTLLSFLKCGFMRNKWTKYCNKINVFLLYCSIYFIARLVLFVIKWNKCFSKIELHLFYCSIYFILLHVKSHHYKPPVISSWKLGSRPLASASDTLAMSPARIHCMNFLCRTYIMHSNKDDSQQRKNTRCLSRWLSGTICSAVLQYTSVRGTRVQIQITSEFLNVYAMRLISRSTTEFVNIYKISVIILC